MSSLAPCPACRETLDVTGLQPQSPLRCPRCQHQFLLGAAVASAALVTPSAEPVSSATWTVRAGGSRAPRAAARRESSALVIGSLASGAVVAIGTLLYALNGGFEPAKRPQRPVAAQSNGATSSRGATDQAKPTNHSDRSSDASPNNLKSAHPRQTAAPGVGRRAASDSNAAEGTESSDTSADSPANSDSDAEMSTSSEPSAADRALANAFISAERSPEPSSEKPNMANGTPGDYPLNPSASTATTQSSDAETPELSPAEKKRQDQIAKLKRLIARQFNVFRRTADRKKGDPADFFVVAKYEMPLSTRQADVTFEISTEIDPSVSRVADYLLKTPSGSLRDFQVVGRFQSAEEADVGIAKVREQYDRAKEYQQQLLAFLQQQQRFQATSIRRC